MGRTYVYHERQLGNLCGVHCVNNLLQGPRFGPGDLAEIGVRLDRKEQKLMGGRKASRGGASANFDGSADGGNFSIQVLRVALARAGLKLLPAEHPEVKELMSDPAHAAGAFVIQRRNHWLALRATGPCWWDLDSLHDRPRPLDEPTLVFELEQLLDDGHSVFLVLGGDLPEPRPPSRDDVDTNWHDACALISPPATGTALGASALPRRPLKEGILATPAAAAAAVDEDVHAAAAFDEGFREEELRAAMALAGGSRPVAADILHKAHHSVQRLLTASPRRLARALTAAVEAVLQARRSLPDCIAHLVVLLCAPEPGRRAAAAALVDCGDLAHRLLEALARKAKGWLWTEGLEKAATVAVDLLLSLPARTEEGLSPGSRSPSDSTARSREEDDRNDDDDDCPASDRKLRAEAAESMISVTAVVSPALVEAAAAEEEHGDGDGDGEGGPRRELDEVFEALDELLARGEDEGRPLSGMRPLVSEPGLKAGGAQAGGNHGARPGGHAGGGKVHNARRGQVPSSLKRWPP